MTDPAIIDTESEPRRHHEDSTDLPSTIASPVASRHLDPIVIPPVGRGERGRTRDLETQDRDRGQERGRRAGRRDADRMPHGAASQTSNNGSTSSPSLGYIPGLDGLRAIAVLAVIGFHVDPSWMPGGFLGVDVFFVVSGFLITTILRRERDRKGWNHLPGFWLRRARRLLPALALLIVVVVPLGRLLAPDSTVGIGRQILGGATFSTNWLEIIAGTDYFAETTRELLRPLWSLAIEEQFYLLWPLGFALLFATGLSARHRVRIVLAATTASAVAMAVLYRMSDGADPTRVYYGTDTHAFGLLLGIALAIGYQPVRPKNRSWASTLVFPVALAGLIALFVFLPADSSWTYPFGLLAASLLTLPLLVECAAASGPFVWALERRPLVWVGRRSYGIYLWHWPALVIIQTQVAAQPRTGRWWFGVIAAVAATFAICAASFRFVEEPIRRHGFRHVLGEVRARVIPRGAVAPRLITAMAGIAVVATVISAASAPSITGAERAVAEGLEAQRLQKEKVAATTNAASTSTTEAPSGSSPTGEQTPTTQAGQPPGPDNEPSSGITAESRSAALSTGDGLTIFGDSVVSAAVPALIERYPNAYVDAKPIRTWADALEFVEAADEQGLLGDFVVLGYGTNGGFQLADTREGLEATLNALGPDRFVVIPTIVGVSHWVDDYNAALTEIAGGRNNVVVADWAATVAGRPGLLHADQTHPNMEGIDVYTEVLAVALGKSEATG